MCSSLNWIPPQALKQEAGTHVSSVHIETSGWDGLGRSGEELPAGQVLRERGGWAGLHGCPGSCLIAVASGVGQVL